MLTKQDLVAVANLIDSRVRPIMKKELEPIKKDLKKIRKNSDYTINFLDKEILTDRKRIEKLENEVKAQKNYL